MGSCQCKETDRKRHKLNLERDTFSEPSLDFTTSSLEPQCITDLLVNKLRPELKKRSVAFVPPITPKLVENIRRGDVVSIGVFIKDTKKLRIKCLSQSKLQTRILFEPSNITIRQILNELSIGPDAEVISEHVSLPKDFEISRFPRSAVTLTILTEGKQDWLSRRVSSDLVIWRVTQAGLNFEGECRNQSCCAYAQIVFMFKGIGSFTLRQDEAYQTNPCPLCDQETTLKSFGVSLCKYTLQSAVEPNCILGRADVEYLRLNSFIELGANAVIVETHSI
jgi:hypothetical protein